MFFFFSVFGHFNWKIPLMETTGTCETMGGKRATHPADLLMSHPWEEHHFNSCWKQFTKWGTCWPAHVPSFVLLPNLDHLFSSLENLSQRFSKAQLTFATYVVETGLLSASFHVKSGGKALWCEQLAAVPEADGNRVQMGVRLQRAGPGRSRACFHFCARLSSGWPSHLRRSIKRFPAKSQERKPPAFQNKRSAGVKCSTTWTVDGLRPHSPHVTASHSTFYLRHS